MSRVSMNYRPGVVLLRSRLQKWHAFLVSQNKPDLVGKDHWDSEPVKERVIVSCTILLLFLLPAIPCQN